ncbi:hypothetical protein [Spongorhabdus nitratireducens]
MNSSRYRLKNSLTLLFLICILWSLEVSSKSGFSFLSESLDKQEKVLLLCGGVTSKEPRLKQGKKKKKTVDNFTEEPVSVDPSLGYSGEAIASWSLSQKELTYLDLVLLSTRSPSLKALIPRLYSSYSAVLGEYISSGAGQYWRKYNYPQLLEEQRLLLLLELMRQKYLEQKCTDKMTWGEMLSFFDSLEEGGCKLIANISSLMSELRGIHDNWQQIGLRLSGKDDFLLNASDLQLLKAEKEFLPFCRHISLVVGGNYGACNYLHQTGQNEWVELLDCWSGRQFGKKAIPCTYNYLLMAVECVAPSKKTYIIERLNSVQEERTLYFNKKISLQEFNVLREINDGLGQDRSILTDYEIVIVVVHCPDLLDCTVNFGRALLGSLDAEASFQAVETDSHPFDHLLVLLQGRQWNEVGTAFLRLKMPIDDFIRAWVFKNECENVQHSLYERMLRPSDPISQVHMERLRQTMSGAHARLEYLFAYKLLGCEEARLMHRMKNGCSIDNVFNTLREKHHPTWGTMFYSCLQFSEDIAAQLVYVENSCNQSFDPQNKSHSQSHSSSSPHMSADSRPFMHTAGPDYPPPYSDEDSKRSGQFTGGTRAGELVHYPGGTPQKLETVTGAYPGQNQPTTSHYVVGYSVDNTPVQRSVTTSCLQSVEPGSSIMKVPPVLHPVPPPPAVITERLQVNDRVPGIIPEPAGSGIAQASISNQPTAPVTEAEQLQVDSYVPPQPAYHSMSMSLMSAALPHDGARPYGLHHPEQHRVREAGRVLKPVQVQEESYQYDSVLAALQGGLDLIKSNAVITGQAFKKWGECNPDAAGCLAVTLISHIRLNAAKGYIVFEVGSGADGVSALISVRALGLASKDEIDKVKVIPSAKDRVDEVCNLMEARTKLQQLAMFVSMRGKTLNTMVFNIEEASSANEVAALELIKAIDGTYAKKRSDSSSFASVFKVLL